MKLSDFRRDDIFSPVFSGELSHAYIISGPYAPDVNALSDTLAAAIICDGDGEKPCGVCHHCRKSVRGIHPDITVIDKADGKNEIVINQIRDIRSDAIVMPNEAQRKVYVIRNADAMNENAQNAFLKYLEEPPKGCAFILACENPSLLLDTVRSRCVSVSVSSEEIDASPEAEKLAEDFFAARDEGAIPFVRFVFGLEKLDRGEFSAFLDSAYALSVRRLGQSSAGGLSSGADFYSKAVTVLQRAKVCSYMNVGSGHICGLIASALTK